MLNTEKKILIADDDKVVHESLGIYLEREGYLYDSAFDGEETLDLANRNVYDLIILDLMMPKISGTEVCKEIRRESDVPIIMLTAKGDEIDKILGLELGADDYIVKPFSPREVIARIKAVLRRGKVNANTNEKKVNLPGLTVSLNNYEVIVDGENVSFTPKEVEILYFLASHPNQVLSREQILENIWGYNYYSATRTVDTHIKRIRQKIGSSEDWALVTVYGIGYKIEVH